MGDSRAQLHHPLRSFRIATGTESKRTETFEHQEILRIHLQKIKVLVRDGQSLTVRPSQSRASNFSQTVSKQSSSSITRCERTLQRNKGNKDLFDLFGDFFDLHLRWVPPKPQVLGLLGCSPQEIFIELQ